MKTNLVVPANHPVTHDPVTAVQAPQPASALNVCSWHVLSTCAVLAWMRQLVAPPHAAAEIVVCENRPPPCESHHTKKRSAAVHGLHGWTGADCMVWVAWVQ